MQAQPVWPTSVLLVLYSSVVGQAVQLEAPAAEYSPAAQFEQTLAPDAENVPMAQLAQLEPPDAAW